MTMMRPSSSSSFEEDPVSRLEQRSTLNLVFDNDEQHVVESNRNGNNNPVLETIQDLLTNADGTLADLQSSEILGSAIVRGCRDLADAVGHLAQELEQHSDDDRRALAEACLQDVQEANNNESVTEYSNYDTNDLAQRLLLLDDEQRVTTMSPLHQELAEMTPGDMESALEGAATLLRDVEAGLRAIDQDDADEIADVALTLARLFLASLQSFHSNAIMEVEQRRSNYNTLQPSDQIAVLDEDSDYNYTVSDAKDHEARMNRLRVLWPPLGPQVAQVCQWGREEAVKQPLLAVALGMTLWPAAVMTACFGAPLVLADTVLQHTYSNFQDGPIVKNLEQGAAQLFQAGKLSWLCGRLMVRQSLRVFNRQVERQGGLGHVAMNLGGMAVDRVLHPVETVSAIWNGIHWGIEQIQQNVQLLTDLERRDAVGRADFV